MIRCYKSPFPKKGGLYLATYSNAASVSKDNVRGMADEEISDQVAGR